MFTSWRRCVSLHLVVGIWPRGVCISCRRGGPRSRCSRSCILGSSSRASLRRCSFWSSRRASSRRCSLWSKRASLRCRRRYCQSALLHWRHDGLTSIRKKMSPSACTRSQVGQGQIVTKRKHNISTVKPDMRTPFMCPQPRGQKNVP